MLKVQHHLQEREDFTVADKIDKRFSNAVDFKIEITKLMNTDAVRSTIGQLNLAYTSFTQNSATLQQALLDFNSNLVYGHMYTPHCLDSALIIAAFRKFFGKRYLLFRNDAVSHMLSGNQPAFHLSHKTAKLQVTMTRTLFKQTAKSLNLDPSKISKDTPLSHAVEAVAKKQIPKNGLVSFLKSQSMSQAQAKALVLSASRQPLVPKQGIKLEKKKVPEIFQGYRYGIVKDSWGDVPVEEGGDTQFTAKVTSVSKYDYASVLWLAYNHVWPRVVQTESLSQLISLFMDAISFMQLSGYIDIARMPAIMDIEQCVDMYLETIEMKIQDSYPKDIVQFTNGESIFSKIKNSEFIHYLQKLVLSVTGAIMSSSLLSNLPFASSFVKIGGIFKEVMDLTAIGDVVNRIIEIFTEQIIPCFVERSLDPLKPIQYKARMVAITHFGLSDQTCFSKDHLLTIIKGWGDSRDYSLEDHYSLRVRVLAISYEMEKFLSRCVTDSASGSISLALTNLLSSQQALIRTIQSNKRYPPFCAGFVGPPNCGKTTYAKSRLMAIMVKPLGLSTNKIEGSNHCEPPTPYTFLISQDFQENVSSSTEAVNFDDMGAFPGQVGTVNEYKGFWDINSGVAVQIAKAALNSKKNEFWNNKITTASSNLPSFGINGHIADKGAFFRRFHVIVYYDEISPEYSARHVYNLRVSELIPGTVNRIEHNISGHTHDEIMDKLDTILITIAEKYIAHKREFCGMLSNNSAVCKTCLLRLEKCSCQVDLIQEELISHIPEGLVPDLTLSTASVFAPYLSQIDDPYLRVLTLTMGVFMEQSMMAMLRDRYGLSIGIILIKMLIDVILQYDRSVTILWLIIHICMWFALYHLSFEGMVMGHLVYDLTVHAHIFPEMKRHLMEKIVVKYISLKREYTPLFYQMWNDCFLGRFVILEPDRSQLGPIARQFADDLVAEAEASMYRRAQEKLPSWKLVFTIIPTLLASKYIYMKIINALFTPKTEFTTIGDIPTSKDMASHQHLSQMIKSGYSGVMHGKTNSWERRIHHVFAPANNTIPNSLKSHVASIEMILTNGTLRKAQGYYHEGYVYTVKHLFHSIPNGVHYELRIQLPGDPNPVIKNIDLANNKTCQVSNYDLLRFPVPIVRRPGVHMIQDVTSILTTNMKFLIDGKEANLLSICGRRTARFSPGSEEVSQPEGSFKLSVQSNLGMSGLPVFMIHDGLKPIQPVFVGIASGRDTTTLEAIVVPLSFPPESMLFTTLPFVVTKELVQHEFEKYGFDLKMQTDERSVCSHLTKEEFDNLGVYCGSLNRTPFSMESNFKKSEIYEQAEQFDERVNEFSIPLLRNTRKGDEYISPLLACVRQMKTSGDIINDAPFISAASVVFDYVYPILKSTLDEMAPLTLHQAIRGTSHTNPMNLKTGFGFPYFHLKKNDAIKGSLEDPLFADWLSSMIMETLTDMDNGIPPLNISNANIKDEIITKKKVELGQERVFFAGNTVFLILCRIYLAPFMDMFMANRHNLFGQIGMNACGPELQDKLFSMFAKLENDPTFKQFLDELGWLDSDYDKYDKVLLVIRFAVLILWWFVCLCPFYKSNIKEKNRIRLILQALQQFIVIIGNDIFIMITRLPSGVFGTAWLNCFCEAILEVLQFYFIIATATNCPTNINFVKELASKHLFFQNVSLANYGDDNLKYIVAKYRAFYTHESIMAFSKWVQMGITPARKHETRIEFKNVQQVLFLKRTPTYNPKYNRIFGVLELTSVVRMLAFTDSSEITWKRDVLDQAQRELAIRLDDKYDLFCKIFEISEDRAHVIERVIKDDQMWLMPTENSIAVELKPKIESDLSEFWSITEIDNISVVPGQTKSAGLNNT